MKNIKIQYLGMLFAIVGVICGSFIIDSYLNYQNKKLQIERNSKLEEEAVKSGMIQVPVDICLEATQKLKWINPNIYLKDVDIITPPISKK